MLTHQQIDILETAWEILDKLRNCKDFNSSHDLTITDGCRVISDFLDYNHQKEKSGSNQSPRQVILASLESFNNF
jgi:hypothetical protein